ncbi:MAG: folylpolyglutamate synthase/dihydrofolate synthase family protein [Porphyromonas sp.]|nr:folylpolyglutamate synthase/dihydrofolate synthase family protein [Porphyromonas sp.]
MTYQETLDYLFTQLPVFQNIGGSAYKPGLERVDALLELCGHPERDLRTIHVAGTNGKGSTSSMLASVLQEMGWRVGLFTSPHLIDFRERIRINGEMISEEYVVSFVEEFRPRIPEGLAPSFFELTTAMAFSYFRDQGVDIAVIEVGMGGRLDSTNVITPLVSIITNVSMDHVAYLGDTLGKIAHEKAGIIKPGVPVVLGRSREEEVLEVIRARAEELGAPLTLADQSDEVIEHHETGLHHDAGVEYETVHYGTFFSPLSGGHQVENVKSVLTSLRLLDEQGLKVTADAVARGMAKVAQVGLRGRLEVLQASAPRVLIDTGHNEGAWNYLQGMMSEWQEDGGLMVLLGMAADKDVDSVLRRLPKGVRLVISHAQGERSMTAEQLAGHALKAGITPLLVEPDVLTAYKNALQLAKELGVGTLFVGGSNFLVGELLGRLPR